MKTTSLIYSRPRDGKGPQTDKSTNGKLFGRSVLGEQREGRDRDVYMVRYWFGPLRFHIMHRGDAGECPHDHPWWFITFPLTSYVEEVLVERTRTVSPEHALGTSDHEVTTLEKELRVVKAFRFHFRPAHYAHRILGPLKKTGAWIDGQFFPTGYKLHMTDGLLALFRRTQPDSYGRKIRTIVLRGSVKWSWGFYLNRQGEWMKAADFFRRNNIQQ